MNFGDFLDNNSCSGGSARIVADLPYNTTNNSAAAIISTAAMPAAVIAQPRLLSQPVFTSPGLSLALQTSMEGQGEAAKIGGNYESSNVGERRGRDEEHESRSGSENMDNCGSGDDHDGADDDKPARKKRYHRHTPQQIQELEALFKECPHPDEKQRLDLSRRLCLETRQVKFWFQNRRTQMKTQLERHENSLLRQENDKLRADNMSIREAMRNPMCSNCGGPSILGEISLEEQHLRIENARLKDELDRVCTVAGKFLGRPISSLALPPIPNSALELGVGSNGFTNLNIVPSTLPIGPLDFLSHLPIMPPTKVTANSVSLDQPLERSMCLELALAAMDELVKMAQTNEPLWVRSHEGDREIFNHEEYVRSFTPCIGGKPNGFVKEASREIGMVIINSLALVETLMDSTKWAEMFPCIIARTTTSDMISSGVGGTRNGALHLMHAELQVVSPLVPIREVNFLRLCKQHAEGIWAVVDVSIDTIRETATGVPVYPSCRRLPSGCVVQDMANGYSKIIWVEHAEYDESEIHELYRPFIAAGLGFGAPRWLATLQRQTECLAILMSSSLTTRDDAPAISAGGRRSMVKLAQRMTSSFCAGVCASTVYKWNKLHRENVSDNVRIMTRKSDDDPSEPPGIVLSAATSVWLPAPPQRLFDFLRNEHLRSEWDILSNGGPMQEMVHIAKGHDHTNCVSLLRANAMNPSQSSMLILQETCVDASGSLVVYAPVDVPAMQVVMNGGDSAYVALLPSGFAILPDGLSGNRRGSLLTVAYQILVNNLPSAKLTVESVETVNNLISCTVQKIRAAL